MKTKLLFVAFLFSGFSSFAQYQLEKGKMQINAGVGLSTWGFPVYGGLDYGFKDDISIGGELTFRAYREKIGKVIYVNNIMGISANGNYHFKRVWKLPDNFDLYAGLNLGFYLWDTEANYPGTHTSLPNLGAQFGGRYFINKNFALNLEAGTGNAFSNGKFGVTFLLK